MTLSHVWLGLPGGHFQSDGGVSSPGALRAMWRKNLKRHSVTMLRRFDCILGAVDVSNVH